MAAARELKIRQAGTVIAGVVQKSISIAGEPLDITDDQSGGWRVLDSAVGRRSVDISIEGVATANGLIGRMLGSTPTLLLTDVDVVWPNGDAMSGDVFLSSLETSGPENDKLGFSATMLSSGEMTFTEV